MGCSMRSDRTGLSRRHCGRGRTTGCRGGGASVVLVSTTLSSKRHGITAGNALMAMAGVVRFRVIARDPVTVRALGEEAQPGDDAAIEAWFASQERGG